MEMITCLPQTYIPEIWSVEKDTIYALKNAVELGLEYAQECLADHDVTLGVQQLKTPLTRLGWKKIFGQ